MLLVCRQVPDAHLIIAGDDNGYAVKLQELIATLPTSFKEKIHFRLNVDEEEKNTIYNSIDVLVLPSKSESFGLVFLEAWACNNPVIGVRNRCCNISYK
jgi:glycosyltransferase involved in cell wall biosynthesis